jgi:hypothetical protein
MLCRGSGTEGPEFGPDLSGRSALRQGLGRGHWRSSCSTVSDSIQSSFAGMSKWTSGYLAKSCLVPERSDSTGRYKWARCWKRANRG